MAEKKEERAQDKEEQCTVNVHYRMVNKAFINGDTNLFVEAEAAFFVRAEHVVLAAHLNSKTFIDSLESEITKNIQTRIDEYPEYKLARHLKAKDFFFGITDIQRLCSCNEYSDGKTEGDDEEIIIVPMEARTTANGIVHKRRLHRFWTGKKGTFTSATHVKMIKEVAQLLGATVFREPLIHLSSVMQRPTVSDS